MSGKRDHPVDSGTELEAETARAMQTLLRAAVEPEALDAGHHAEILARALEDPWAPPTEAERVDAVVLRDALAGHGQHPSARICSVLRAAYEPSPVSPSTISQLVSLALRRRRLPRVLRLSLAPAAALALAAGFAILLTWPSSGGRAPSSRGVMASRSTATLFHGKFELAGNSARLDTIVAVRTRDFRKNRYSRWGLE
jgi:hypothetical protein